MVPVGVVPSGKGFTIAILKELFPVVISAALFGKTWPGLLVEFRVFVPFAGAQCSPGTSLGTPSACMSANSEHHLDMHSLDGAVQHYVLYISSSSFIT